MRLINTSNYLGSHPRNGPMIGPTSRFLSSFKESIECSHGHEHNAGVGKRHWDPNLTVRSKVDGSDLPKTNSGLLEEILRDLVFWSEDKAGFRVCDEENSTWQADDRSIAHQTASQKGGSLVVDEYYEEEVLRPTSD